MRAADPTHALRTLIAALPEDRLRALLLEILLGKLPSGAATADPPEPSAPTRRRAGWPRGKPRGPRKAKRRTAARRRSAKPRGGVGQDSDPVADPAAEQANGSADDATTIITAATFWTHGKSSTEPARGSPSREFDVKEPIAHNCNRNVRLPPHVGPMAIERFLSLETDAR